MVIDPASQMLLHFRQATSCPVPPNYSIPQPAQQPPDLLMWLSRATCGCHWTFSSLVVALEAWEAFYMWLRRVFVLHVVQILQISAEIVFELECQSHNCPSDRNGFGLKRE